MTIRNSLGQGTVGRKSLDKNSKTLRNVIFIINGGGNIESS
jgi:hypothetical protein